MEEEITGCSAGACLASFTNLYEFERMKPLERLHATRPKLTGVHPIPPVPPINVEPEIHHADIADAMVAHGGDFIKRLGHALFHADYDNQRKIREGWPKEWAKYAAMCQQKGD